MRYLLNSAVITAFGRYDYRPSTVDEARDYVRAGAVSTIGYQQTADALSELVGLPVAMDRRTITMQPGDTALVFRLTFPPGSARIDPADKGRLAAALIAGHFELGVLERLA